LFFGILQFICMFSYFTGNSSFPQPLSPEEERYYLDKYKEGDNIAKNILIERNLRLVAHIVKKYTGVNKEVDDLISIGTIGLIKAISSYDLDKGTRLATYAARCIENEILMSIRSSKKQRNEISLQAPIGTDKEGNEIALIDILCNDSESILEQVDFKIRLKKLYQKMKTALKRREKDVLEMRYGLETGDEKTQREIADLLGISRSYVSRIEKKAIKKLSDELTE
jgi:RNA polymerase sporulation-specific sigma factor